MKRLFVLAIAALMVASLNAQEVKETTVAIGSLNAPAYTLTLQTDKKVVQDALEQRLKDAKLKTKKSEGFQASLGAVFQEIAPTPINFYYKIDGNSKSTTMTVCAMSTDLSANQQTINSNVVNFLNNFTQYLTKREAAKQLVVAQDALKKAQKEQKNAASDLAKIEKSTEKTRKKIEELDKNIKKWQDNIAEAEKNVRKYNAEIEKSTGSKLTDAQKRVQQADKAVNEAESNVEKWRQLAQ